IALGFRSSVEKFSAPVNAPPIVIKDPRLALDAVQKRTVEKCLDPAERFNLIQGPPGTGKTTVIVELVRQFYEQGKKVLVVSQSNPAIDNIALKLLALQNTEPDLLFARVGNNQESIDERVCGNNSLKKTILAQMKKSGKGQIVLGTNNGFILDTAVADDEFYAADYDVVIVEEAGRATFTETLFPISYARDNFRGNRPNDSKAILVGDHKQLPAYGIDDEEIAEIKETLKHRTSSSERWLDMVLHPSRIREFKTSLFETMWNEKGFFEDGVNRHFLNTNRRSHPVIALLVSKLFYAMTIKADDPKNHLPLEPDTIKLIDYARGEDISKVRRGTEGEIYEEKVGTSYRNVREAVIAVKEIERVMSQYDASGKYRYGLEDITVITPYKPQRKMISKAVLVRAILNDMWNRNIPADTAFSAERLELLRGTLNGELNASEKSYVESAIRALGGISRDDRSFEKQMLNVSGLFMFLPGKPDFSKRCLSYTDIPKLNLFEVETVDSAQGAENKVVILSLVRSNRGGEIGFMGTDDGLQRLNVAFSRAQEKFILIGDFTHTLTKEPVASAKKSPNYWRAKRIFRDTVEYMNLLYPAKGPGQGLGPGAKRAGTPADGQRAKGIEHSGRATTMPSALCSLPEGPQCEHLPIFDMKGRVLIGEILKAVAAVKAHGDRPMLWRVALELKISPGKLKMYIIAKLKRIPKDLGVIDEKIGINGGPGLILTDLVITDAVKSCRTNLFLPTVSAVADNIGMEKRALTAYIISSGREPAFYGIFDDELSDEKIMATADLLEGAGETPTLDTAAYSAGHKTNYFNHFILTKAGAAARERIQKARVIITSETVKASVARLKEKGISHPTRKDVTKDMGLLNGGALGRAAKDKAFNLTACGVEDDKVIMKPHNDRLWLAELLKIAAPEDTQKYIKVILSMLANGELGIVSAFSLIWAVLRQKADSVTIDHEIAKITGKTWSNVSARLIGTAKDIPAKNGVIEIIKTHAIKMMDASRNVQKAKKILNMIHSIETGEKAFAKDDVAFMVDFAKPFAFLFPELKVKRIGSDDDVNLNEDQKLALLASFLGGDTFSGIARALGAKVGDISIAVSKFCLM
ncbi:MAG: AAA family ATPase, partial [Candidatus Omnitrophica bacterium]|nr:AAA family ATPase [Candidatus Omnitrophota bacterium]